jgi:hypothetical protein
MTVAAFLAFALTSFRALAQLGELAAVGMAVSLVATFWILPPLLALTGRGRDESRPTTSFGLPRLWRLLERRPHAVVGLAGLATVLAAGYLATAPGPVVRLESDLRNLLPKADRTFEVQEAIALRFGVSPDVGLVVARAADEEGVLEALAGFEGALAPLVAEGSVAGYESPARWLPPRSAQERARARLAAVDPDRVAADLREALRGSGFKLAAFEGAIARTRELLRPPSLVTRATLEGAGLGELVAALRTEPGGRAIGLLTAFPAPGRDGLLALERANATIGPEVSPAPAAPCVVVTGVGTIVRALVASLERDVRRATLAAALAVVLIALVHFRALGPTAAACAPVFVGFLWMLAVMKRLDLPVNFMNVIVFPMVIGIEDNAIHVVHRWRELRSTGGAPGALARTLDEIGLALFLCTATTMLGFGSLVLSDNRGLASIGVVTLIGKATAWVASTVALPAAIALKERAERRHGGHPSI